MFTMYHHLILLYFQLVTLKFPNFGEYAFVSYGIQFHRKNFENKPSGLQVRINLNLTFFEINEEEFSSRILREKIFFSVTGIEPMTFQIPLARSNS